MNKTMRGTFYQYVIPSMLAFALSGVYSIVDGFFVGNSIGDHGLAHQYGLSINCPDPVGGNRNRHGRCGAVFYL